jgi:hypothetical protein
MALKLHKKMPKKVVPRNDWNPASFFGSMDWEMGRGGHRLILN